MTCVNFEILKCCVCFFVDFLALEALTGTDYFGTVEWDGIYHWYCGVGINEEEKHLVPGIFNAKSSYQWRKSWKST